MAIVTTLHPSLFLYCIVNIRQFMGLHYLVFNACLSLRFLDMETNSGPPRPVPDVCCRILCILSVNSGKLCMNVVISVDLLKF